MFYCVFTVYRNFTPVPLAKKNTLFLSGLLIVFYSAKIACAVFKPELWSNCL